jgi:2-C-methyl-D-erythritol 4-phosphate cytidylyltransferase
VKDPEHLPPVPGCVAVIMPAAGSGRRFGSPGNKLFETLGGKPLWFQAASRLRDCSLVGRIVMPIAAADRDKFASDYAAMVRELRIELVEGGAERTDSVKRGLNMLADDEMIQLIAIHDAARPLVTQADLHAVFAVAGQTGAAILATPMPGTVKRAISDGGCHTVDRRDLWIALTPQVFKPDILQQAYRKYRGRPATDDAELVERIGHPVSIVKGSASNLKITHHEDLLLAEAILERQVDHA